MRLVRRWIIALTGVTASVQVALAAPAAIENLQLNSSGNQTTLVVSLSDTSQYRLFTLSSPDRIVVDIVTARLSARALPLPPGTGAVYQLRAANRPDGSVRLVLDMAARAEPQGVMRRAAGATGNRLILDLVTAAVARAAPSPMPMQARRPGPQRTGRLSGLNQLRPRSWR